MAVVLLGVAAVIGGFGVHLVVRQARFIRRAERVDGTIRRYDAVKTKTAKGTTASTTLCTIGFTTTDGRPGRIERIVLTRRKAPGTAVGVVYDPDDLERAQVVGSFWQWGTPAIVVGVAVVAAAAGLALPG